MVSLQHKIRRGIALLISLAMLFGIVPTGAALDDGADKSAGGYSDEIQTAVKYLNADRTEAEITLTKKATPHDPVNLIFLVDASVANQSARLDVQQAFRYWLYDYFYDYGTAHPMKIISYGADVTATDFITDKVTASNTTIMPADGIADEIKALQAAKNAVAAAHMAYPQNQTVVIWVPSATLSKTDDEIRPVLESLKNAYKADDALITFQKKGGEPSALLKDYATEYTSAGEQATVPAAYACTSGASENLFARFFRDTVGKVVHDHYNNISVPLKLSDTQSMVKAIGEIACASGAVTANATPDGKGVDLTINGLSREATLTLTMRVTLEPSKKEKQVIFKEMNLSGTDFGRNGGLYTGVFDEKQVPNFKLRIAAVELNRANNTITYDLGEGVEGSAPAPVTAMAGTKVAIADSTHFTKSGSTFGGWVTQIDGETLRYQPGKIVAMPERDITLMPVWGHTNIKLEVASAEAPQFGNTMRDNLGLTSGLDFSNVMIDGKTVGTNIRSITFQNQAITDATMDDPHGADPYKATLSNVPEAKYARFIGEGDLTKNPVFAYLINSASNPGKYDMIITGPGGVTAPAHITALFSAVKANQPAQGWQSGLEEIEFNGNFHTQYTEDLRFLFYYCERLTSITGLDNLDLSSATTLRGMFRSNVARTEIDLSNWDTSNVQDMSYLLADCPNLTRVNLTWSAEDTQNLTTIRNFFTRDTKLETITGVEQWVLPNVIDLTAIFYLCEALKSVDLSAWMPGNVTDAAHLLRNCSNLETITIEGWDVPKLQSLSLAFSGIQKVKEIDLSTWRNLDSFNDFYSTFANCDQLETVKTPGFCKGNYGSMAFYCTFGDTPNLKEWDISGWEIETNKHGNYGALGDIAVWGNDNSGRPTGVKITADNWTLTGDAKVAEVKWPWLCNNKQDLISANNWNLNDTPQNLNRLFKKLLGTNSSNPFSSLTDFSGWTGLAGVTDMSGMFESANNLQTVSITDANLPNLITAADMFSGATSLTAIDFSGWSGVTTQSVLTDIFKGVSGGSVQLTASDDEIGGWLKTAWTANDQGTNPSASESDVNGTPSGNFITLDTPNPSNLPADLAPRSQVDEEMLLSAAKTGSPRAAVYAPQDSQQKESNGAVDIYEHLTPVGTELTIRATVKYEGDLGAQSNAIDLSIPLPENMEMASEPEITRSGFRYSGTETGFIGGSVHVEPYVDNTGDGRPVLRATFSGMYSGTEIAVSFKGKLKDTTQSGDYKLWDITGYTRRAEATAASNTLRFWWSQNGTKPTGEYYQVVYQFAGDIPVDAELPDTTLYQLNDTVTFAAQPNTAKDYYTWKGWRSKDVSVEGPDFQMPNRNVLITGIWALDESRAPKITVMYTYDGSEPETAPNLPQPKQVVIGRDHEILDVSGITDYYTFGGWIPTLDVGSQKNITGTEQDGLYTFLVNGTSYTIDMSENGGTLMTEQFRNTVDTGSAVTVCFTGTWNPYTGTVRFDKNGGSGSMADMTGVTYDDARALSKNTFSRAEHIFGGWSLYPNGQVIREDEGPAGGLITQAGQTVTLYAQWYSRTHHVRYQLDNVTADPQPASVQHGSPFHTTLSPASGMKIKKVKIEMNGRDVTDSAYDPVTGRVEIVKADADILIEASADKESGSSGGGATITYPIQVKTSGEGTAVSSKNRASSGETVVITISGTEESITVVSDKTGKAVDLTEKDNGKYTFQMPASAVTVTVRFKGESEVASPEDTGVADWLITNEHIKYLNGYGNGTFGPNSAMTRAEAAQMLYNLLLDKEVPVTVRFRDVPETAWYKTAVDTLASLGIVNGTGNHTFTPERPITRAEFTAIAMRFAKQDTRGESIFSDVPKTVWYYNDVIGSTQYGWVNGYSDGTFRPNNTITRAEVATIVNRMLGRSADESYVDQHTAELTQFSDVGKSFWGYYDIMEAANAHDHQKIDQVESWTALTA